MWEKNPDPAYKNPSRQGPFSKSDGLKGSSDMNLILLGAPGSGKGTQAERLQAQFKIVHIASGDLFRENLKNDTELGKQANKYINKGELVPDEVTIGMVHERVKEPDTHNGIVFDGFPRTIPQAEALNAIMENLGRQIDKVLHLRVSDEEIVHRLSRRLVCSQCQAPFHKDFNPFQTCPYDRCQGEYLFQREDDKPEIVRARLEVYHNQTSPLISFYEEAGLLTPVNGEGTLEEVSEAISKALLPFED
jgi:adenylate kinase